MRVAAIDVGTNTARLLVASAADDGSLIEHDRRLSFVRLGQDVDATRQFHPDALARARVCFEDFAAVIDRLGCERRRLVATSATRDVTNRAELASIVHELLGTELDVISGDAESRLSFTGALSGAMNPSVPVLVIDSGGGSTELIRGLPDGTIEAGISIDLGSRRIKERYLHSDPATPSEIATARSVIEDALDHCGVRLDDIATFIGVAGTVTSIAALAQGLPAYDRAKVHGYPANRARVHEVTEQLLSSSAAQVAALGPVAPERAEVLAAGALIVDAIAARVATDEMVASEADILDGIALVLLADAPN